MALALHTNSYHFENSYWWDRPSDAYVMALRRRAFEGSWIHQQHSHFGVSVMALYCMDYSSEKQLQVTIAVLSSSFDLSYWYLTVVARDTGHWKPN